MVIPNFSRLFLFAVLTLSFVADVRAQEDDSTVGVYGWSSEKVSNYQIAAATESGIYEGVLNAGRPKALVSRRGLRLTCSNTFPTLPFGFLLTSNKKKLTVSFSNGAVFRAALRGTKFKAKTKFGGRVVTLEITLPRNRLSAKIKFTQRSFVAPGAICDYPYAGVVFLVG